VLLVAGLLVRRVAHAGVAVGVAADAGAAVVSANRTTSTETGGMTTETTSDAVGGCVECVGCVGVGLGLGLKPDARDDSYKQQGGNVQTANHTRTNRTTRTGLRTDACEAEVEVEVETSRLLCV